MKEQVHEIEVSCELDAMQAEFVYEAQRAELRRITLDSPSAPEALRRRQLTTSETATASMLRAAAIGLPAVMLLDIGDVISAHGMGVLLRLRLLG
jgi:hypothetical protein